MYTKPYTPNLLLLAPKAAGSEVTIRLTRDSITVTTPDGTPFTTPLPRMRHAANTAVRHMRRNGTAYATLAEAAAAQRQNSPSQ